jgi:hypothetical protein
MDIAFNGEDLPKFMGSHCARQSSDGILELTFRSVVVVAHVLSNIHCQCRKSYGARTDTVYQAGCHTTLRMSHEGPHSTAWSSYGIQQSRADMSQRMPADPWNLQLIANLVLVLFGFRNRMSF